VRAIIRNIVSAGLPPDHIMEFLVALTVDGNYFPKDFLWDSEIKALQFDE
jgi:hypothetical protein